MDYIGGWLKQLKNAYKGEKVICPVCGCEAESKFYVFDDGVGFGDFVCTECGASHHLCRIKYPDNIDIKPISV